MFDFLLLKPVVPPGLAGSLKRTDLRKENGRRPLPPSPPRPACGKTPASSCGHRRPRKNREERTVTSGLVLWAVTSGLGRLETGSTKCSPTGNGQLLRALATLALQSSCSSRVQVMPAALWPWSQPLAVLSHTNSSAR